MDIRHIRNFLAVVEAGSIARAAVSLHIAQPALSAQMRRLEDTLGCQLLVRSSKGVTPTAAGMELGKRGRGALDAFATLRLVGRDMAAAPSGPVKVGLPASVGTMLSIPLVEAVVRLYPGIELGLLEATSADLGELLVRGKLDLAVLFEDNLIATMQHEAILEEDLFVVSADMDREEIPLAALHGLPLVMPARPNSVRLLLDKACTRKGVVPRIVAEISSPHSMLQLAQAGIGATVLPWSMVGGQWPANLHAARIVSPTLTRTLCLAGTAAGQDSPRNLAMRTLLRDILQRLVASHWTGARLKTSRASAPRQPRRTPGSRPPSL
ncbi:MAG: LysR substrate-binding domain-containing protein [Polaromonas sp.]|nr:LysR substrate-binding domain-containing protein [Polaromonas sp.]